MVSRTCIRIGEILFHGMAGLLSKERSVNFPKVIDGDEQGATSKHLHFNVTNASLEAEKRALYYLDIKCMPAPYKHSFPDRLFVAFDTWE
ncbi:hypothetical protein D5086_002636 [Populus alba]|uniref:Uncharacterized protein n=2 Tax=Populus TaxID=3689 RepID=A0ACC4D4B6_POPAL